MDSGDKMNLSIYHIDAFASELFEGKPAKRLVELIV